MDERQADRDQDESDRWAWGDDKSLHYGDCQYCGEMNESETEACPCPESQAEVE